MKEINYKAKSGMLVLLLTLALYVASVFWFIYGINSLNIPLIVVTSLW